MLNKVLYFWGFNLPNKLFIYMVLTFVMFALSIPAVTQKQIEAEAARGYEPKIPSECKILTSSPKENTEIRYTISCTPS